MANSACTRLFIFFIFSALFLSSATELATEVCKNTTDFAFCREAIYSDPRAPSADRYVLAYIVFDQAYLNATDTNTYITSTMKSAVGKSNTLHAGLAKCQGYYVKAIKSISEALNDLDSETMNGLDKISNDVCHCARHCEASFHGRSPMAKKNDDLIKLSNICLVVSNLFEYQ